MIDTHWSTATPEERETIRNAVTGGVGSVLGVPFDNLPVRMKEQRLSALRAMRALSFTDVEMN